MESFKDGVIYSRHYPEIDVERAVQEDGEFCQNDPRIPTPSLEEILARAEARYTYERRPDAVETSQKFIGLAIGLSEAYEINLDLTKHERYICARMDIAFASYSGEVKHRFDALMAIADRVSLFYNQSKPDYIVASIDYYFYDRYRKDTGEKVEW